MAVVSIMIEGQDGLNWPRWKRLTTEVERLGFAGLFRSDHFTNAQPPEKDSLEMVVSLAHVAERTQRIHFGPLVAPVSFRDPIMLARQAAALHDLSEGRMILGLGAGWQGREHHLFGYELGDIPTRFARLEEALVVATRLLRSEVAEPFEGRFFQLREGACLLPRPAWAGGPPIMIGGNGPKRTLPLVARYADIWNATHLTPEGFRELSGELDRLLAAAGRPAQAVRRTMMHGLAFGRTIEEVERLLAWRRRSPELADRPLEEVQEQLYRQGRILAGTAPVIAEYLNTYIAAGVEEIILQWFELDDPDRLAAFASEVLPLLG